MRLHREKMPGIRGIISGARSMRLGRTTGGNLSESSKQNIQQSHSDSMAIQKVNTDDSSVFSGLASVQNGGDDDENKSIRSVHVQDEFSSTDEASGDKMSTRRKHTQQKRNGKPTQMGALMGATESISEEDEENTEQCTDNVFHSDENGSFLRKDNSYNQDSSTVSYESSVNDFHRPKSTLRLVSDIQLIHSENTQDQEYEHAIEPPTPEGAEAIKNMLRNFGRELDESLMEIADEEYRALEEEQDIIARRSQSSGHYDDIPSQETKLLQTNLHQLRKENFVLKENNEQFIYEIEQTTEEHKSDMKLYDERAKQKLYELKAMHQEEIDALIQEKDAAIAEAGRRAAQFAESGRMEIDTLKEQITKLKHHMKEAVKKAVEDATTGVKHQKELEIISRLGALRTSYESMLQRVKVESEDSVKTALNGAVGTVTQQMLEERETLGLDDEILKTIAKQSVVQLVRNEEAIVKALQSVKENLNKHYPKQIMDLRERSHPNPMVSLREQEETSSEKLLKEVVEAFAFLLETAESKTHTDQKCMERNSMHVPFMQQLQDAKRKIEGLEKDLKVVTREKRLVQERFRRDAENHRMEVQKLKSTIEQLDGGQKSALASDSATTEPTKDGKEVDVSAQRLSDDFSLDLKVAHSESYDEVESARSPVGSPLHGWDIHSEALQGERVNERAEDHDSTKFFDNSVTQKQELILSDKEPPKKKSFAILRGFRPTRGDTRGVENHCPDQDHGKNNHAEKVEDSNRSQRSKPCTVSRIRNMMDTVGRDDVSHDRQDSFSDECVSNLRPCAGVDSAARSKSMRSSRTINADNVGVDQTTPSLTPATHSVHSRIRKKKNPLGMFANRRKQSLSPENAMEYDQDESPQSLPVLAHRCSESVDSCDIQGTSKDATLTENKSSKQPKTPLHGLYSLKKSSKEKKIPHVMDGRKSPHAGLTANDKTRMKVESSKRAGGGFGLPSAIDLQSNATKKHSTPDCDVGHTMFLHPLLQVEGKCSDAVSCVADESKNPFLQSLRNNFHESISEEYSSEPQFLPPGDQSDDESRDESIDKYQSVEHPESTRAPVKVEKGIVEEFPVDRMYSSSSKPIAVQGQSFSRKHKLSALTRKKDSETTSEATTANTADTCRSSFNTEPSKLLELARNPPSPIGGSSKRATAMSALKARRARRVAEC